MNTRTATLALASPYGDAHLGQILTAKTIEAIPAEYKLGDWGWPRVIGDLEEFAQDMWIPHYLLGKEKLPDLGWLGATLFADPSTKTSSGTFVGAKIWWKTRQHFKDFVNHPTLFDEVVADLSDERWKGIRGDRWDAPLKPGLIILAGDPVPPFPRMHLAA